MIARAGHVRRLPCTRSTSTPRSSPTSSAAAPQDRDDPPRRQVAEVPEGHDRRRCSCGARYGPREQVFDAVIDKVEVKTLGELSPREIEHDNPEIRRAEEMARFLGQLYNREVTEDDTVTLIRFSAIQPPPRPALRVAGLADRRTPKMLRLAADGAPHSSHSTANADEKRAPHAGQRERSSPRALRDTRREALALELLEVALGEPAARGRTRPSRRASCAAPPGASSAAAFPIGHRHDRSSGGTIAAGG